MCKCVLICGRSLHSYFLDFLKQGTQKINEWVKFILLIKSGTPHSIFPENFGNRILLFLVFYTASIQVDILVFVKMTSSQNVAFSNNSNLNSNLKTI